MEPVVAVFSAMCLVGLFLVFLRQRASHAPTEPRLRRQLLPVIVFEFGRWVLVGVLPSLRYLRLTPNAVSFLSLPASVCAAASIATGHLGLGAALLSFAFSFDAWDGALARELGAASEAGEIVDATIDRYNDVVVMLGFLYYFRAELIPWLIASAALIGTVAVSYTRAKGAAFGIDPDIGFMQRHERAVWLTGATAIAPMLAALEEPSSHPTYYAVVVALGIVAIGTNVTAVLRARLVIATLMRRRGTESVGLEMPRGRAH
jgi:phosphatidylglycerophosphate synthase